MNRFSKTALVVLLAFNQFAMAQTQTTTVVLEQPKTVVEATPVAETQAEKLRKLRQDSEIQNEQKIVEKLEASRLEDEKARIEKLFGQKTAAPAMAPVEEKKVEAPTPVAAPVQQPVAAPVIVPVQIQESGSKVSAEDLATAKKEIIEAIKTKEESRVETQSEAQVAMELPAETVVASEKYYISGGLGTAQYGSSQNIQGQAAAGFTVGVQTDEHMSFEGQFQYSNYFMDDYRWVTGQAIFKEMDQYSVGAAIKYNLLTGRIKPVVGVGMAYTFRKYFDRYEYVWNGYIPADNQASSSSVDLSASVGLDFAVNDRISVGVEYRYSTNLIYRSESEILDQKYRADGTTAVEESDYSTFLINGKLHF